MQRHQRTRPAITLFILLTLLLPIIPLSLNASSDSRIGTSNGDSSNVYLPLVTNDLAPIIPDTTHVLTEETTDRLISISEDGVLFTFAEITSELAALAPGNVIVGEPAVAAPYGFLRKVTSVEHIDGQVNVTTAFATLEDAVEQGTFVFNRTFSPDDVIAINTIDRVSVRPLASSSINNEGWYIEITGPSLGCVGYCAYSRRNVQ